MSVRYTPAALADMNDIFNTIALSNPVAAQNVEDRVRDTTDRLGQFPGVGARTDLEDVRRLPLVRYPYTIYYRIVSAENSVEILRIVHAASIKSLRQLPK